MWWSCSIAGENTYCQRREEVNALLFIIFTCILCNLKTKFPVCVILILTGKVCDDFLKPFLTTGREKEKKIPTPRKSYYRVMKFWQCIHAVRMHGIGFEMLYFISTIFYNFSFFCTLWSVNLKKDSVIEQMLSNSSNCWYSLNYLVLFV